MTVAWQFTTRSPDVMFGGPWSTRCRQGRPEGKMVPWPSEFGNRVKQALLLKDLSEPLMS